MNALKTQHDLDFEVGLWIVPGFKRFRVGTCKGLFRQTDCTIDILSIVNDSPGNGHLNDVMEWFEYSCKFSGYVFRILEVWNLEFKEHLIKKRGFKDFGNNSVAKIVKNGA